MSRYVLDVDGGHGDNGPMASPDARDLRGSSFTGTDLTGARFRDCDMRHVKIISSVLVDVSVSGEIENFFVNGIDVTGYVAAELDRRHPERVLVREMKTVADHHKAWQTIETLWSDTLTRAGRLPEPFLHERVEDEWSLVETLRHLVFATDLWVSQLILDLPASYHRLALPPSDHPPEALASLGLDLDAHPTYTEVLSVRSERAALVRDVLGHLTEDRLRSRCPGTFPPAWDEPSPSVGEALAVMMEEEIEHHRYALRDLRALESRRG
ncbi:DinB family protein [Streptosporangium longisporum]|uniref:DinB family protein n=1 Tax=Streptosporangium longisporum TaxID=46187 RepID=A0ABN3XT00_9ACTN